jgi:tripartite-type tricarboxylate transporter receptor subunit TctC
MGGRLDFSSTVVASAAELIDSGMLRLIGVFSAGRHPDYPNVPTAREQGIDALQFSQVGLYAPRGVPEPVLARLERACRSSMDDPEVIRVAAITRVVLRYVDRAAFTHMVQEEYVNYGCILRELGVQPE